MPRHREPDESRRSERARSAIHEATAELLRTVGYDAMSIEGIAAKAAVGKQTIYRWWPSKAAVVIDVWVEAIPARTRFPDTGDLAADLKTQMKGVIDLLADPMVGPELVSVVADSQRDERLATQLVDRILAPRIDDCKERLRAGQAAGQLREDIDLDTVMDLLYGGLYYRRLFRVGPLDHALADALVDAALSGIGTDSRRPTRPPGPRRTRPKRVGQ